eukprot:m.440938 g.440938  ORF g.440938 m.440938 type:complete len:350 (+) comp18595_c0_seq1:200-1249(+)
MADMLMAMGYDEALAKAAIAQTGGDVQKAVDYILSGSITAPAGTGGGGGTAAPSAGRKLVDDSPADAEMTADSGETAAAAATGDAMDVDAASSGGGLKVRVLVCTDTGMQFSTQEQAARYAERTGHSNFEEKEVDAPPPPKPLTEEEKKAKLEAIKQKMKEKRAAKEAAEREEEKEKEKVRRKTGAEVAKAKADYEARQLAKLAAEKKREREAERAHKAKVKALLQQDELNRKAAAKGGAAGATAVSAAVPPAAAPAQAPPAETKVYTECRIQLRPPAGAGRPVTATFPATETVGAILSHAAANIPALAGQSFALVMTRPRKEFTQADAGTLISDSGLMPSAALMVQLK